MKVVSLLLVDKQLSVISERIIEEAIKGIDSTKPARIPTAYDLKRAIDEIKIVLGKPSFQAIPQIILEDNNIVDTTSASKFNANLYNLIDDFTVLTNTLVAQIYSLTSQFSATEYEMYAIGNRLRALYAEVTRILLTTRNAQGFLHAIGNTFNEPSSSLYIQEGLDIDGGAARLSLDKSRKIDLSSIRGIEVVPSVRGSSSISFIGTTMAQAIDDIEDDYCMIQLVTDDPNQSTSTGIRIIIPLSNNNTPIDISEVILKIPGKNTFVNLLYTNAYTSSPLPIKSYLPPDKAMGILGFYDDSYATVNRENTNDKAVFTISPNTLEGGVANPGILSLVIGLYRNKPDEIIDGKGYYNFNIANISVMASKGRQTYGYFISNPMAFNTTHNDFSANQLSLSSRESLPEGCRVDYQVAVDPWVAGYLTAGGNKLSGAGVTSDYSNTLSSGNFGFTPDANYTGTDGVRTSELRRLGVAGYTIWDPSWTPILPIERSSSGTSLDGTIHDKVVNLGAYTVTEDASSFVSSVARASGGIDFYDIYQFSSYPKDVTLRQGRHCWVQKTSDREKYKTAEVQGVYLLKTTGTGVSDTYTIVIGPDEVENLIGGVVKSPGLLVKGGIKNITLDRGNIDDYKQHYYLYDDVDNGIAADFIVDYTDGVATITSSKVTSVDKNHPMKLVYTYKDPIDYSIIETNIFIPMGSSPYITLNNGSGSVRKVIISAPETDGAVGKVYDTGVLVGPPRLLLQQGWNKISIYLSSGVIWDPTVNVTLPKGMEWYAYYEPLEYVGDNTMYHISNKFDHTKCSVRFDGTNYYLFVNDPLAPLGTVTSNTTGSIYNNDGVLYWKEDGTIVDDPTDIFGSSSSVNDFYDLSYKVIGEYYTHVIVKGVLTGSNNSTPVIYSYEVRGGDSLNISVEV